MGTSYANEEEAGRRAERECRGLVSGHLMILDLLSDGSSVQPGAWDGRRLGITVRRDRPYLRLHVYIIIYTCAVLGAEFRRCVKSRGGRLGLPARP